MKSLKLSKILLCSFGTILLFSNCLAKVNESIGWEVNFEGTQYELRVNEPKEFRIIIENLRISNYNDSVHVLSSDERIVQVTCTGFMYDFDESRWRGIFIATPVGIGSANVFVEVVWSTHTDTSSESLMINVHRNRFKIFDSLVFQYIDYFISIVFYVTIGMVLNWRKWCAIFQRPAGLCDVFCIDMIVMLLVSERIFFFQL